MRFLLVFHILFLSNFTFSQNWNLIWNDEFNGTNLDLNKWSHDIGTGSQNGMMGWGNNERQYYKQGNSIVSNGTLKIIAKEEQQGIVDSWNNTYYYSSSRITTKDNFNFRYGKIVARIKTLEVKVFGLHSGCYH